MEEPSSAAHLHGGHRDRMRERYYQSGIDSLSDHEKLELLLYYAIPRKDTNLIAHRLLHACGSLSAVFDAPRSLLKEQGLSDNTITLLKYVLDLGRCYHQDRYYTSSKTYSKEYLMKKVVSFFLGWKTEGVLLVLFDEKGRELFFGIVNTGVFNSSEMNIRRITELAMKYQAASVVLAHNHPSGVLFPSNQDIEATILLKNTLSPIGIRLSDHIIVANNNCLAFTNDPMLLEIFL